MFSRRFTEFAVAAACAGILTPWLAAEGRPLFYWGGRAPCIEVPRPTPAERQRGEARPAAEARVTEVHAALDAQELVLRFTFDRPVVSATRLPDGAPVSGRLRAVLYLDRDGDRSTGWAAGEADLRRGAEGRLEIGVLALGADPDEHIEAQAVITATLHALSGRGSRRTLWRGDDEAAPGHVSARGDWLEVRLPRGAWPAAPGTRLVLAEGERMFDGRVGAP